MHDATAPPASGSAQVMLAFISRWQALVLRTGDGGTPEVAAEAECLIAGLPETVTRADRLIVERIVVEFIVRLAKRADASAQASVSRSVMSFIATPRSPFAWKTEVLRFVHESVIPLISTPPPARGVLPPIVRCSLDAIHDRYADPWLRLSRLASELQVSPGHLSRLLTAHTGKAFLTHLHDRRTQVADERLRTSLSNVQQTALLVGYSGAAQLRRQYVRRYGATPAAVRTAVAHGES